MSIQEYDIFVGCYGSVKEETIHWLKFDSTKGTLSKKQSITGVENPSFLTVDPKRNRLYTVSEVEEGEVVSFEIDFQTNHIEELNRQSTMGEPCYLEIDRTCNYLLTANYGGGSLIVHLLNNDGKIERKTDFKDYQASRTSHLHTIRNIPNTTNYIATDLGLNQIYFYDFDNQKGKLILHKILEVPKDSGPRHIDFHPSKNLLFVVNEHKSTILTYVYDKHINNIHLLQELSTVPNEFKKDNYGADIHVTPCGQYVYVSNRGHHSLALFEVLESGQLSAIGHTFVEGEWPRNFTIMPNGKHILVANEHTDNIVVMEILSNGSLEYTGNQYQVENPVCLKVI